MPRYFGSAYTVPAPPGAPTTITTAPHGGWTQIPSAKALYDSGAATTYLGYVEGTSGNIELVYIPDSTGTPSSPIVLHASFQVDTHAAPAMIVDSVTGKLLVMYSGHNGGLLYYRRSVTAVATDPDLSDGFEAEATIGISQVTYPILVQRNSETSSPIYVWYRTGSGSATKLAYRKTTNCGTTWSAQTVVFQYPNAYWKITCDGLWRIDFFVTSGGPPGDSSIYHFYADSTDYHKSDGTVITGSLPFGPSQFTQVYDMTTDGPGWPTDAIWNGSAPAMVYSVNNASNTDTYFAFALWNGSSWDLSTILSSVGWGIVDPSPVAALDASVLTKCHLVRRIAGRFELWKYTTADSGATWTGTALTVSSSVDNLYPISIAGHTAGQLGILWLAGPYTSATSNSLGILGVTA